jgi:hypothetical protein
MTAPADPASGPPRSAPQPSEGERFVDLGAGDFTACGLGPVRRPIPLVTIRALAVALGFAAAIAAGTIGGLGSSQPVWRGHSVATLSATTLLGVIALVGGAIGLSARWARIVQSLLRRTEGRIGGRTASGMLIALALGLVPFSSLWMTMANRNIHPRDDQGDILNLAERLRTGELGVVQLARGLLDGSWREDNRHPLHLALLAALPVAGADQEFVAAKWASGVVSLAVMAVVATLGLRRFGFGPTVIGIGLLAVNRSWIMSAATVGCEPLLAGLITLVWLAFTGRRRSPALSGSLSGAALALAWLTKASALFCLPGMLLHLNQPTFRQGLARLLALAGIFFLLASPLLWRNAIVYRNPFHSFNTQFLFADRFDPTGNPDHRSLGADSLRYLRTRGIDEGLHRLIRGVGVQAFIQARSLGPMPFDSERASLGIPLLGLAALGMFARRREDRDAWLFPAWLLTFHLFFAWYEPIATSDRFTLPLLPLLLLFAGDGMVRLLSLARGWKGAERLALPVAIGIVAWSAIRFMVGPTVYYRPL